MNYKEAISLIDDYVNDDGPCLVVCHEAAEAMTVLDTKVKELEADLLTAGEIIIDLTNASEAFNEAIQFALDDDEPRTFLSYWNEGEWDVLRRDWPEFTIHKSLNEEIK